MLELFITACLAGAPDICAERMIPGVAACQTDGADIAQGWAERHGLSLTAHRCATVETTLELARIADGVFVHQGHHEIPTARNHGDIANIGFIVGEEAVAVIDAGGSRNVAERLYAAIRAETDLPIRYLFLTHMHPDHALGASVFVEAGAAVVAHARFDAALAARFENYRDSMIRLIGPATAIGTTPVTADIIVEERMQFDLGGRTLRATAHATAHTDNDLTILDTAANIVWTGDLVFHGHTPAIDGSVVGWIEVLGRLMQADGTSAVPGHGAPSLPWPGGGQATLDYLSRLAEQTREAIARGLSLGTAAETVGQDLRGDWELFDEFHPRNVTSAYTELEWE